MKNKPGWVAQDLEELAATLHNAKNIREISLFLRDLLTEKELIELSNRWKVARMLRIKMAWSKITRLTGVSSATIAQINKKMKNKNGGFNLFLNKLFDN